MTEECYDIVKIDPHGFGISFKENMMSIIHLETRVVLFTKKPASIDDVRLFSYCFTADGSSLVAMTFNKCSVIDVNTGNIVVSYVSDNRCPTALAYAGTVEVFERKIICSMLNSCKVEIRSLDTCNIETVLTFDSVVKKVCLSKYGYVYIATQSELHIYNLSHIPSPVAKLLLAEPINTIAVDDSGIVCDRASAENTKIVVVSHNGKAQFYNVK